VTTKRTLTSTFDWRAEELEWPVTTEVGAGLAGVIATTTEVMWLDPASGSLGYRGRPVELLALGSSFEEVAFLLITGSAAEEDEAGYQGFREKLRTGRELPEDVITLIQDLDPGIHPTRLLRAGVSALGCHELSVDDDLTGDRHWRELRIVGQVASLVAVIGAHRAGRPASAPDPETSLAGGLLSTLRDGEPDPEDTRLLDLLWILYAAHGLDAPTFTSMIVASCLADPYFNVVAGLSALRGPRQGGAGEAVMEQLGALERAESAPDLVKQRLNDGRSIAGFGHRSYHLPDPRAVILRRELAALARRYGRTDVFERALAIETAATASLAPRGVHVNINFYAAPIFHLLGADAAMVPCLFAVGRMAGLVALVREAIDTIRLIRPRSRYVGAAERGLLPEAQP